MAERSQQRAQNLTFVHAFLQRFNSYPVDSETGDIYGRLKADLMRHFGPKEKSKRIKTTIQQLGFTDNDLWIASTAIQHGLTVVSSDSDFQRMQAAWVFPVEAW
ncbi:MAG TPA: type II toxin-antitoxin system VapC family toxin [Chloroflexia bacterium]|jgi:tRNA(fMet)-specific endonuclease VapC